MYEPDTRRQFLLNAGKTLGLAAAVVPAIQALVADLHAAGQRVAALSPVDAARDEDFWVTAQQAFSTGRGIVNLNNGGVSPSPKIVTEALVRYIWQSEDTTAYTMWQILEPQSERIRKGLADAFGCDAEEIAITRNASESLEILLNGFDLRAGDEILTSTQDYPRMLTTLRQRALREGIVLKTVDSDRPAECRRNHPRLRAGDHSEDADHPRLSRHQHHWTDHAGAGHLRAGTIPWDRGDRRRRAFVRSFSVHPR